MHQFTDKDISLIKEKTTYLINAIKYYNFDLESYINLGIISKEKCNAIYYFIQNNNDCIKNLTPLALPLQPLINVAKYLILDERERRIKEIIQRANSVKRPRSSYDFWLEDHCYNYNSGLYH